MAKEAAVHPATGDMAEEQFERSLQQLCDWLLRYRRNIEEFPVLPQVKPGEIAAALPEKPPAEGESFERCLEDFKRVILPGITHWNHPGFMAYFAVSGSGPGILGELAAAALNTQGMLWKTSPAQTELEIVVLRWLARALGLPSDWFGMLTDTASTSTLVALAAAREATGANVREEGLSGQPPLVVYCSEEAHISVDKACMTLGIGRRYLRKIAADAEFRMRADALEAAIASDRAAGRRPCAVVATVGTTSCTAVDPVPEIARVCRRHGVWLHVDAAYAGCAAVAPEFRRALEGCESADSFTTNPHKWLFTPIDCSALWTSRPQEFLKAYSLVPEYLKTSAGETVDFMNYTFQLGRRFRALKLWFVMRYFGTEGLAARIREHCALAREFASWVDERRSLERLAPAKFSVVCFRAHPPGLDDEAALERLNAAAVERVNSTGEVFLSHTRLGGKFCVRVAIGHLRTSREHVRRAFDLFCQAAGV
jgi:aromatic-L-amino-acid decarboxylase